MNEQSAAAIRQEVQALVDREIKNVLNLIEGNGKSIQITEHARRIAELSEAIQSLEVLSSQRHANLLEDINLLKGTIKANARIAAIILTIVGLVISVLSLWLNNRAPGP